MLINKAWQRVANHGRAQNFAQPHLIVMDEPGIREVASVSTKFRGTVGLITDTDLVEAVTGIAYYMLQQGFFAMKFSIARAGRGGKRTVLGDFEFYRDHD